MKKSILLLILSIYVPLLFFICLFLWALTPGDTIDKISVTIIMLLVISSVIALFICIGNFLLGKFINIWINYRNSSKFWIQYIAERNKIHPIVTILIALLFFKLLFMIFQ